MYDRTEGTKTLELRGDAAKKKVKKTGRPVSSATKLVQADVKKGTDQRAIKGKKSKNSKRAENKAASRKPLNPFSIEAEKQPIPFTRLQFLKVTNKLGRWLRWVIYRKDVPSAKMFQLLPYAFQEMYRWRRDTSVRKEAATVSLPLTEKEKAITRQLKAMPFLLDLKNFDEAYQFNFKDDSFTRERDQTEDPLCFIYRTINRTVFSRERYFREDELMQLHQAGRDFYAVRVREALQRGYRLKVGSFPFPSFDLDNYYAKFVREAVERARKKQPVQKLKSSVQSTGKQTESDFKGVPVATLIQARGFNPRDFLVQ